MPSLSELHAAATEFIAILKGMRELEDAYIAVIGGLALWTYIPEGRATEDVDFIISIASAPDGVKSKLLALPNSPFIQHAQVFFYRNPAGHYVQIDITPSWQSPYMPLTAMQLKHIPANYVPYITPVDLIVFKINSCGLRAQSAKKRTDAADAETLVLKMTATAPIRLTSAQAQIVLACLSDVVANGTMTLAWWKQHLGL